MLYASLDERGVLGGIDICICMVEYLRCSLETITTLLTGYTSIQNKNLEKKKKETLSKTHQNKNVKNQKQRKS